MDQLLNQHPRLDLPMGFYFTPTDKQLIMYLNKKINDQPIPYEFIPTVNLYKNHPQELTEAYPSLGINDWYFFTTRDRKYLNGSRPNRTTGTGYWKASAADKRIYDQNNVCIGSKRSLVFYQGNSPNGKKTIWLMQEYTINQLPSKQHKGTNDMLLDKCVLCRIYMNSRRCTKVEEDAAIISCQVEEYENNKSFETGNQATNETMNIGQQTMSLRGQQDIDLLVQQPNCLMVQQHNFPIVQYSHCPTDQIGGPLSYSFGSTSDNTSQINNMENLENDFLADASSGGARNYFLPGLEF